MVILGIRIPSRRHCLSPLLLVLAFPAAADIDFSILRAAAKAAPSAPRSAAAKLPPATAEESPDDWYRRAIALDRPGASGTIRWTFQSALPPAQPAFPPVTRTDGSGSFHLDETTRTDPRQMYELQQSAVDPHAVYKRGRVALQDVVGAPI